MDIIVFICLFSTPFCLPTQTGTQPSSTLPDTNKGCLTQVTQAKCSCYLGPGGREVFAAADKT